MRKLAKERVGSAAVRGALGLAGALAAVLAGACAGGAKKADGGGGAASGTKAPSQAPAAVPADPEADFYLSGPAAAAPAATNARPVTVRVLRKAPPMSDVLAAEIGRRPVAEIVPFLGSPDAEERRIAVRALGRAGGDEAAQEAATLLRDSDASVREEACFAVGVTGSPLAAGLLGPVLEAKPSRAEVAAAAAGLAACRDDAAGDLLVRLACRDEMPVEAAEAIFRQNRIREHTWTGTALPAAGLLRYEKHPTARGRAALGWFGRIWKDPALLTPLIRLAHDPDPEVRRAVALGLGDGKPPAAPGAAEPPKTRAVADADVAVVALIALAARDQDVGVDVAATRALSSYDRDDAKAAVRAMLSHTNFHIVTTAAEGSGARKDVMAFESLAARAAGSSEDLGRGPERIWWQSPSVRYAAAKACLAIDSKQAQTLVDALLADASDFVRSAGAEILDASDDPAAVSRLVALATNDPGIRTREAAIGGLKQKDTPEVRAAVEKILAGDDPVMAAIAAEVAATNHWTDMAPTLRKTFTRFAGTPGADARQGIVMALGMLGRPEDVEFVTKAADDPDAGVRTAARAAFAERAGVAAPKDWDRRPRREGAALPFNAKLLDGDVDLIVETSEGTMKIQLDASEAPIHAAHLADLARKGFYDGLTWHRVVADFVIQGGCPRGDGSGNAGVTLPLEPTRTPFVRGTLGMPRDNHPDTGGCQLFICHSRAPHLDVTYAAIGQVVEGLDVIDRIDVGSKIVRVRVADRTVDGK